MLSVDKRGVFRENEEGRSRMKSQKAKFFRSRGDSRQG